MSQRHELTTINSSDETVQQVSNIDCGVGASNQQAEVHPNSDAGRPSTEEQDPNENMTKDFGDSTTNQGGESKSNSTDLPLESRQVFPGNPYNRFEIDDDGKGKPK